MHGYCGEKVIEDLGEREKSDGEEVLYEGFEEGPGRVSRAQFTTENFARASRGTLSFCLAMFFERLKRKENGPGG